MSEFSLFDLSNRVAFVTGAGSGLGRSFSSALATHGAKVVCADIDLTRAEETQELIRSAGGEACAVRVDVADAASVDGAISQAVARYAQLHIVINNAGIVSNPVRTHELSTEDWDRVVDIDLKGVFFCTRAAIPELRKVDGAAIVNIASIAGVLGFYPGFSGVASNYVAAKAGVIGFTRQVAAEYAGDGIRVNAIAPGFHAGTRLAEVRRATASADDIRRFNDAVLGRTPLGRKGSPEELNGLVLYLASNASSYVTGQVFCHDGGWTAT